LHCQGELIKSSLREKKKKANVRNKKNLIRSVHEKAVNGRAEKSYCVGKKSEKKNNWMEKRDPRPTVRARKNEQKEETETRRFLAYFGTQKIKMEQVGLHRRNPGHDSGLQRRGVKQRNC